MWLFSAANWYTCMGDRSRGRGGIKGEVGGGGDCAIPPYTSCLGLAISLAGGQGERRGIFILIHSGVARSAGGR